MDKRELDMLIDKLILGTLTNVEKVKLDTYIMENPNTTLEIKMRTDIIKGFEYNHDQELKNILNNIHKDEISTSKGFRYWRIAGIILLGLIIAFGAYTVYDLSITKKQNVIENNGALYAKYFQPFEPSMESRNNEIIQEKTFQNFMNAYKAKDYQESLKTIRPYLADADNNTLLMAGIAAMENGQDQESLNYFDRIIDSNDFYFSDHAKWYKGLLLVKTKKINDAKSIFMELAKEPKADHYDESVLLLKEF